MKLNIKEKSERIFTYEGGKAVKTSSYAELERAVACCLLWEDTFYEKGNDLAQRIERLCAEVPAQDIASLAVKARHEWNLRHVPLWLVLQLVKQGKSFVSKDFAGPKEYIARAIYDVINRADEITELMAMWKKFGGSRSYPNQLKEGLRAAFTKFDRYHFAKYNRKGTCTFKYALSLLHPKPKDDEQSQVWKQLMEGTLEAPDTWEVALSGGADKKAAFERLLTENKLGYLALLRNLRNMESAGVRSELIREKLVIKDPGKTKVLPYRFIAASRYSPGFSAELSEQMLAITSGMEKMRGKTIIVVDVSGSMDWQLSGKTEMKRMDAATGVAILLRELCADGASVWSFSNDAVRVANHRGLPLAEAVVKSQGHAGTSLGHSLETIKASEPEAERIVVITDEQSSDHVIPCWAKKGYLINVATYAPVLPTAHFGWKRINGFSERVVDWILLEESLSNVS